jgi:hypothetical protein
MNVTKKYNELEGVQGFKLPFKVFFVCVWEFDELGDHQLNDINDIKYPNNGVIFSGNLTFSILLLFLLLFLLFAFQGNKSDIFDSAAQISMETSIGCEEVASNNIRVSVRVRPLAIQEERTPSFDVDDSTITFKNGPKHASWTLDHVLDEHTSQADAYGDAKGTYFAAIRSISASDFSLFVFWASYEMFICLKWGKTQPKCVHFVQ